MQTHTTEPPAPDSMHCATVVLDTNIVLDLLVFNDPATAPLAQGLRGVTLQWIATQAMRDELQRVLDYPKIRPRLAFYGISAPGVLQGFDSMVRLCAVAPPAGMRCKDADDQKFIDLAVVHTALLLSKDHAVLRMTKRLATCGVWAGPALPAPAPR